MGKMSMVAHIYIVVTTRYKNPLPKDVKEKKEFAQWQTYVQVICIILVMRGAVVKWLEQLGYGAESRRKA